VAELKSVRLVNLHPRMDDSVLVDWLKQEGDLVRCGEPLYIVETRKGVFEVPSEFDGRIARLLVGRGASVVPGQEVALIELVA
jgi:pyruvate/2-oxoglutarate dehydrogenase complex dihydrolipoamide acyltransferase (E2) component